MKYTTVLATAVVVLAAVTSISVAQSPKTGEWVHTWTASPQPDWGPDFLLR